MAWKDINSITPINIPPLHLDIHWSIIVSLEDDPLLRRDKSGNEVNISPLNRIIVTPHFNVVSSNLTKSIWYLLSSCRTTVLSL